MSIEFIQPVFNNFTLEFPPTPPLTEADLAQAIIRAADDLAYEAAAEARAVGNAVDRKAMRTRKRLEAIVAGGWVIEFQPRQHLGLQNSTRPERRRAQLGRI